MRGEEKKGRAKVKEVRMTCARVKAPEPGWSTHNRVPTAWDYSSRIHFLLPFSLLHFCLTGSSFLFLSSISISVILSTNNPRAQNSDPSQFRSLTIRLKQLDRRIWRELQISFIFSSIVFIFRTFFNQIFAESNFIDHQSLRHWKTKKMVHGKLYYHIRGTFYVEKKIALINYLVFGFRFRKKKNGGVGGRAINVSKIFDYE